MAEVDRDHAVNLSNFRLDVSNLVAATEILHALVHNEGDERHLEWMTDKLLDDADQLSKTYSYFDADIDRLHREEDGAQAAE